MPNGKRKSLAAADWTRAALHALARGGLAAIAVEPLAKELGATKGSFYWHFADRLALVQATLELWERRDTEQVIAAIDDDLEVETRLRNLLRLAFMSVLDRSIGGAGTVEFALQASAALPGVAPTLERVTKRRVTLLTRLYTELGLSRTAALDRGLLASVRPTTPMHPTTAPSGADWSTARAAALGRCAASRRPRRVKDDDVVVVCQNRGTRLHDRGSDVVGLGEVGQDVIMNCLIRTGPLRKRRSLSGTVRRRRPIPRCIPAQ